MSAFTREKLFFMPNFILQQVKDIATKLIRSTFSVFAHEKINNFYWYSTWNPIFRSPPWKNVCQKRIWRKIEKINWLFVPVTAIKTEGKIGSLWRKVWEMNINSAQVLSLTWQWIISASLDSHIKAARRLMFLRSFFFFFSLFICRGV